MSERIFVQKHHFLKYQLVSLLEFWTPSKKLAEDCVDRMATDPEYGLSDETIRKKRIESITQIIESARTFRLRSLPNGQPDIICSGCPHMDCSIPLDRRR